MRYLHNIIAILALISTVSCTVDNIDSPKMSSKDAVTVIGRITCFRDHDVTTRGVKNQDEAKLTSMAMALFKVNAAGDGLDGGCVFYQYADDQAELLFTIERGSNYEYDTRYAMYIFTNMPGMGDFGVGDTLEQMMVAFYDVKNIDIPTNGFPMMGSLGDTFSTTFDKDGKVFILSPRENGELTTPKVDGVTQTLLTIPMKAMYAKVNFTIEVRPDQTIEGNYSPQFTLEGYTVNNVPSKVDFNNSTNSDNEVLTDSFSPAITGNTVASGANKINFSFYLPERMLEPTTKPANYDYPFKKDGKIRGEDSIYMQRYKPMLVGDKKATNVVISGRFRDHQNHHWDVDYTIYLGEDNYGDFNVKRNSEYNNVITIRGIQSSSDMSDEQDAISIDHRVNVERTQPAIISLRREVLLDSHFEVRPLRVRQSDVADASINAVKVEVVNPTTTNWMRLERSFGDGTAEGSPTNASGKCIYINENPDDAAYGKRRYFTYNLVNGATPGTYDHSLVNSTSVILPLTEATECCWIYVDECTEVGDAVRSGVIKVSYGSYDGTEFTPANNANYPDVNYVINQRKLFQVTGENTYNIEYSEEYLYNFDADDDFGQTEYEGMEWGLNGVQLSYDYSSLYFGNQSNSFLGSLINGIVNFIKNNIGVDPLYDFYIPKHDTAVSTYATKRAYSGYIFCNEIIQEVNGATGNDTDATNNIDVLQLNEQPKSAVEYCYNKNKRNSEGHVVWQNTDGTYDQSQLNWYLPAIDEIEDIVMSKYGNNLNTYARFLEFQDKYYWSSQPAFIRNFARYEIYATYNGEYYYDDVNNARATSVWYDSSNQKFDYARSGVTSYFNAIRIYGGIFSSEYEILKSGSYQGHTLGTITREAGNRPRTSQARIRCVRKQ